MNRLTSLLAASMICTFGASELAADSAKRDRFSLGLHASGGGLSDANEEDTGDVEPLEIGGMGISARYGISRRWDIEASVEGVSGETPELRRTLGIFTVGARFRFNPTARWRWSLAAGIGGAGEEAEVLNSDGQTILTREFSHGVFTLGGGLERRFRRFGISAELHAMGLVRDDEAGDGPEFVGKNSPVPQESTIGAFRLSATYYF